MKAIPENNINGKKPKNVIHDGAGVNSNGFYHSSYSVFHYAFDPLSFPVCVTDDFGEVILVNKIFKELFGENTVQIITAKISQKSKELQSLNILFHRMNFSKPVIDDKINLIDKSGSYQSYYFASFIYYNYPDKLWISFVYLDKFINLENILNDAFLTTQVLQNHAEKVDKYCIDGLKNIREVFDLRVGFIHLYYPDQDRYIMAAQSGLPPEICFTLKYLSIKDSQDDIGSSAFRSGEKIIIYRLSDSKIGRFLLDQNNGDGYKTLIHIPLSYNNEYHGMVTLLSENKILPQHSSLKSVHKFVGEFAQGIHEKKLIELLLKTNLNYEQQAKYIREANKVKSDYIANICQELQSPINFIIDHSLILSSDKYKLKKEEEIGFSKKIFLKSQYLLAVVNDILDLAKIEAGKIETNISEFSITETLSELLTNLEPLLESKYQTINITHKFINDKIITDKQKLQQILYNIFSNAVKYSPNSNNIFLSIKKEVQSFKFVISFKSIKDYKDDHAKLFLSFQEIIFGEEIINTGLGLSISKSLAELLGGEITVEKGDDGLININLYVRDNSDGLNEIKTFETNQTAQATRLENENINCLIIGDNYYSIRWLEYLIRRSGIESTMLDGFSSFLLIAKSESPAVIIVDISEDNPLIWNYISEIKSDQAVSNIPLVVISGPDTKRKAFQQGAVDYFSKPVSGNFITNRLQKLI